MNVPAYIPPKWLAWHVLPGRRQFTCSMCGKGGLDSGYYTSKDSRIPVCLTCGDKLIREEEKAQKPAPAPKRKRHR